jgi:hypothetical protein
MRTKYPLIRLGIGFTGTVVSEVKEFKCGRCTNEFSIEIEYLEEGKRAEIVSLLCPACFTQILQENPFLESYFAVDLPMLSEALH